MEQKIADLLSSLKTIELVSGTKLISLTTMLTSIYEASPVNMEEVVREIKELADDLDVIHINL